MRRLFRSSRLALCLAAAISMRVLAQKPAESLCFSPRPLSECERFLFFDAALVAGLLRAPHELRPTNVQAGITFSNRNVEDLSHYGAGIIGFMSNRDSTHAVGGSIEFGYDGEHPRISAKLHRRTWFTDRRSLDLSFGPKAVEVVGLDDGPTAQCIGCAIRTWSYGVTGDMVVTERHGFGLLLGTDLIQGGGRTSAGIHAGTRMESYTAVAATILAGVLGVAAYYIVGSAY